MPHLLTYDEAAFEENENSILGYHDHEQYLNSPFLNIEAIVKPHALVKDKKVFTIPR